MILIIIIIAYLVGACQYVDSKKIIVTLTIGNRYKVIYAVLFPESLRNHYKISDNNFEVEPQITGYFENKSVNYFEADVSLF